MYFCHNYKVNNILYANQNWDYNSQIQFILHFTEKKGWRCERRYDEPPPLEDMPMPCKKEIPICFCREAHLYWKLFDLAETIANQTLALTKG